MEDVYDLIIRQDIIKKSNISEHCVQTALKSFTYSYLDLEQRNFGIDQKRIRLFRSFKEKVMILRPDKDQGINILNNSDYYQPVDNISSD